MTIPATSTAPTAKSKPVDPIPATLSNCSQPGSQGVKSRTAPPATNAIIRNTIRAEARNFWISFVSPCPKYRPTRIPTTPPIPRSPRPPSEINFWKAMYALLTSKPIAPTSSRVQTRPIALVRIRVASWSMYASRVELRRSHNHCFRPVLSAINTPFAASRTGDDARWQKPFFRPRQFGGQAVIPRLAQDEPQFQREVDPRAVADVQTGWLVR